MVTRLDAKQIDYIIRECKKGRKTAQIAAEVKIGQRRVQQISDGDPSLPPPTRRLHI